MDLNIPSYFRKLGKYENLFKTHYVLKFICLGNLNVGKGGDQTIENHSGGSNTIGSNDRFPQKNGKHMVESDN